MAIIWNLPLDHSQNEFKGGKKKKEKLIPGNASYSLR